MPSNFASPRADVSNLKERFEADLLRRKFAMGPRSPAKSARDAKFAALYHKAVDCAHEANESTDESFRRHGEAIAAAVAKLSDLLTSDQAIDGATLKKAAAELERLVEDEHAHQQVVARDGDDEDGYSFRRAAAEPVEETPPMMMATRPAARSDTAESDLSPRAAREVCRLLIKSGFKPSDETWRRATSAP